MKVGKHIALSGNTRERERWSKREREQQRDW